MKRHFKFAIMCVLAALPLAAYLAEPLPHDAASQAGRNALPKEEPTPLFDDLDVNHDGYLTREEAKRSAQVTARFKELDTNHDGRVDAEEFKKGMQPKL